MLYSMHFKILVTFQNILSKNLKLFQILDNALKMMKIPAVMGLSVNEDSGKIIINARVNKVPEDLINLTI